MRAVEYCSKNPSIVNWGCWLTQKTLLHFLYNGHTVVVIVCCYVVMWCVLRNGSPVVPVRKMVAAGSNSDSVVSDGDVV